jgi:tRNA A-37 threonylcarbamoyl transferase component Bud32
MDIEQPDVLLGYLKARGHIGRSERPRCTRLSGGVSNRTVLVEREAGGDWVMKQALGKLRVAVDWYSGPERVHREALGMQWLGELVPDGSVPELVFEDRDHHLLAMQAVPQPHANWKTLLLDGQLLPDHVEQFGRLIGTIHRKGYERRNELSLVFGDRSYLESLRLEPFYVYTATQVPAAAAFLGELVAQTRSRCLTLVHGDYSPKNVLVYEGRIVLLDHETIHFGDPALDVGFSLAHLLSKSNHLVEMRTAFAEAAGTYWSIYRNTIGDDEWTDGLEYHAVRHTLGCLLARVAGRSRLEYLDEVARQRQRVAVTSLMTDPPGRIEDLVNRFVDQL